MRGYTWGGGGIPTPRIRQCRLRAVTPQAPLAAQVPGGFLAEGRRISVFSPLHRVPMPKPIALPDGCRVGSGCWRPRWPRGGGPDSHMRVSRPRLGSARNTTRVRAGLIPQWSMRVIGEMGCSSEPPRQEVRAHPQPLRLRSAGSHRRRRLGLTSRLPGLTTTAPAAKPVTVHACTPVDSPQTRLFNGAGVCHRGNSRAPQRPGPQALTSPFSSSVQMLMTRRGVASRSCWGWSCRGRSGRSPGHLDTATDVGCRRHPGILGDH